MKRVKSAPKTIVFKNSRRNITFAFGIGYDRNEIYYSMYDN